MKSFEQKVSANKYKMITLPDERSSAKVKFRVKGSESDGVLYQGQQLIAPCRNCPKP
jgi:hypothetical protein